MNVAPIPPPGGVPAPVPSTGLERQLMAERALVRSVIRGTLIALPITIAVVIGMMALAISDTQAWYVWVGLGAGLGVYCAGFFGVVGGVMSSAHRLDQIEEDTPPH